MPGKPKISAGASSTCAAAPPVINRPGIRALPSARSIDIATIGSANNGRPMNQIFMYAVIIGSITSSAPMTRNRCGPNRRPTTASDTTSINTSNNVCVPSTYARVRSPRPRVRDMIDVAPTPRPIEIDDRPITIGNEKLTAASGCVPMRPM